MDEKKTEAGEEGTRTRKITEKDWKLVETYIKGELDRRKQLDFRRDHEQIWREVDRQLSMKPMQKAPRDQSEGGSWNNVFELGELARASENYAADVRRIIFPHSRSWFEPHSEIEFPMDPKTGRPVRDQAMQDSSDGTLKALMAQQHTDFGFKDRFELSVKEALHHGSFVAEVRMEDMEMVYEGTKTKTVSAPVWVPHSMWNCYPDPSPSIIGTNMFYNGSMIIESYIPRHKLFEMASGDGWMKSGLKKVPKDEHNVKENRTKDVKLTTFWGDIVIPRSDEDIYFPNHKVILANGKCVYFAPMKLPFMEIIYRGYEKIDVRDPYYTSPIIKFSPIQKMGTILANRFIDSVELNVEKPIVYDGNDPGMVETGGPVIAPGSKIPAKTSYDTKFLETADPRVALEGLQYTMEYLQSNLGRPGAPVGDRATAEEVIKKQQDSEAGMTGFVDKLESGVRSYLYMQHEMNIREMSPYSFYNAEAGNPDFMRVTKDSLPKSVHFEIVGARGVLGERARSQGMMNVTAAAAGSPLFQGWLKPHEILKQAYLDVGVKHPESFIKEPQEMPFPPQIMQMIQQGKMQLQQMAKALQDEKTGNAVKLEKIHKDYEAKIFKVIADMESKQKQTDHANESQVISLAQTLIKEVGSDNRHARELVAALGDKAPKQEKDAGNPQGPSTNDILMKLTDNMTALHKAVTKPKKRKIKAPSGKEYQVTEE